MKLTEQMICMIQDHFRFTIEEIDLITSSGFEFECEIEVCPNISRQGINENTYISIESCAQSLEK